MTDLIPARPFAVLVLLLAPLVAIVGLNALNLQFVQQRTTLTVEEAAPFRLAGKATLSTAFSSLLLGGAAVLAGLIFAVRRHRLDDYRGRYRLWLWSGALLVYASVDTQTGLHDTLGGLVARLAGTGPTSNSALWWMMLYAPICVIAAAWMLNEMKNSRGAIAALALAVCGYAACGLFAFDVSPTIAPSAQLQTMLTANLLFAGHYFLCASLLIYARYVHLDAQQKLPARRRRRKAISREKDDSADKKSASRPVSKRTDLDPAPARAKKRQEKPARPATTKPTKPAPANESTNRGAPDDDELGQAPKLSKAERRRLRKLRRRQQETAEV